MADKKNRFTIFNAQTNDRREISEDEWPTYESKNYVRVNDDDITTSGGMRGSTTSRDTPSDR